MIKIIIGDSIIFIILLLGYSSAYGQVSLKGGVKDTILDRECPFAVVALLSNDSTLLYFTRSHKDGTFFLSGIPSGVYRLLITHPSFADTTIAVNIADNKVTDMGSIFLVPEGQMLSSVTVMPAISLLPRKKGDTLEYNTANIRSPVNSSVEELLMRLSGIKVDQTGNVYINGKKVDRLMIEGEDIFGGNPTLITKNFNADMIARVQVLDKESKQAEFTGVNDDAKKTTINFILKEDSKKGYFLKAEGGDGSGEYYNANGLAGSFKGHRQMAVLAMTGNTGITDFGDDQGGFSVDINPVSASNDPFDANAGVGIPSVTGAGLHYADRWNNQKNHISTDYNYGQLSTHPVTSMVTVQTLPDSVYTRQQQSSSDNTRHKHMLIADLDFATGNHSAFSLYLGGATVQGNNFLHAAGSSSFNDTMVNSNMRNIRSEGQVREFRSKAMWRIQSWKKAGRIFSIVAELQQEKNMDSGFLLAENDFYRLDGTHLNSDTTDQRKVLDAANRIINTSLNYTEPLWKNIGLQMSYTMESVRSSSVLSAYRKGGGEYDVWVDSLSNNYLSSMYSHQAIVNIQAKYNRFSYVGGGHILYYTTSQTDRIKNSTFRYHYVSFNPMVNIGYNINDRKDVKFVYMGISQPPPVVLLQPVQNNNDPLHVNRGNPDLHSAFSHSFSVSYHSYQSSMLTMQAGYTFTTNGISSMTYTDSLGRQISKPVNVNGARTVSGGATVSRHMKKINFDVDGNVNVNYAKMMNYINQYLSRNDGYTTGGGLGIRKFVPGKYNFRISSGFSYTYTRSSVNMLAAIQYWGYQHSANISIYPGAGWEIGTYANYNWRQKLDQLDRNNTVLMWNTFLKKNLYRNRLSVRIQISDILGQNAGINRKTTANQTTETVSQVIGRYWMLSATWRFMHHSKAE